MDAVIAVKVFLISIILLFSVLSSSNAFSAEYYFTGGQWGSARAACAAVNANNNICFYHERNRYTIDFVHYFWTNFPDSITDYVADEWEMQDNGEYTRKPEQVICESPEVLNPNNDSCSLCASGHFDDLSGSCLDIADSCSGMSTLNLADNSVGSCDNQDCSSPTGSLLYDPAFDFCQGYADICEQKGGSYGAVGSGGINTHVCITDAPGLAECSAVSAFDDGTGQYVASCTGRTVSNSICDTTKYDCDNDGAIDDQNSDGCVDNGVAGGSCVGTTTGARSPDSPLRNVGENDFETATEGAGQCDPTSKNYSDCIGDSTSSESLDLLTEIRDLALESSEFYFGSDDPLDVDSSPEIGDEFFDRYNAIPIVIAMNRTIAFSGNPVCPSPEFSAFGSTFSISYHCTLYDYLSGILGALMIAFYSILGLRHIMSA